MREIKFRIWDCDTGEYVREGWHIGHKIYANRDIQSPDPFGEILEQYTGLRDKNGKEIYEGDIVKTAIGDWLPCNYTVGYGDGYWFPLVEIEDGYNAIDRYRPENFEIVGNIHENPELL